MLLSQETITGLLMTSHCYHHHSNNVLFVFFTKAQSFIELVPYLFSLSGVKSFLSQRICQDPLELYFGCQRQRGGTHDNPTAAEFYKNAQALRVVNAFCKTSPTSNCRGSMADGMDTGKPLPKRCTKRALPPKK